MPAFDYPAPQNRRHGPRGYTAYRSFRPWLRDEFSFRCVYCLSREQWGRVSAEYGVDHFAARKTDPDRALEYDNLVYACARCNSVKAAQRVPEPSACLTVESLRVRADGKLECHTEEAESLVLKLNLNSPVMVSWRLLWMRIIELARENDESLYRRLLGYPADLPNLSRLKPPRGNSRPNGVRNSHFARAARGELPIEY